MKPHKPNSNKIDEFFNEHLPKAGTEMPGVEEFWTRIDPYKRKRRSPFLLWFSFGILGLLMGWWVINSDTPSVVSSELAGKSAAHPIKAAPSSKVEAELAVEVSKKVEQKKASRNQESTIATPTKVQASPRLDHAVSDTYPKLDATTHVVSEQTTRRNLQPILKTEPEPVVEKFIAKTSVLLNKEVDVSASTSDSSTPSIVVEKTPDNSTKNILRNSINLLETLLISELRFDRDIRTAKEIILSRTQSRRKVNSNNHHSWFWEVNVGVGKVFENIGRTDCSMSALLAENYSHSVDALASYKVQLSIGKNLSQRTALSIGIEYQHIESQHSVFTETTRVEQQWNPEAYINNSGFVGGLVDVEINQRGLALSSIRETSFNVPLRFHLELLQSEKWSLGANAGVVANLTRSYSGPRLGADNVWYNPDQLDLQWLGLSYEVGMEVGCNVSPKRSFYMTPRFRYNSSNYFDEDFPLRLRKNLLGVQVGFRSKF